METSQNKKQVENKLLVISDIHLGGENCNSSKLIDVLKKETCEILVINGDLLDSCHFHRLNKEQWRVLSILRKISKNTKVILVKGNHDYFDLEILTNLLGFEAYDDYSIKIKDTTFHFVHGHIFDLIMTKMKWFTELVAEAYYQLCRNSWLRKHLNRWLHADKHIFKTDIKIKRAASIYRTQKQADWIVCGHTHFAEKDESVKYLNSGTFCSSSPTYITIDFDGIPKLVTT